MNFFEYIPKYKFASMPRQTGRGGGAGIYIKNTFDFSIKVCPTFPHITFKYISIEIKIKENVCVFLNIFY